MSKVDCRTLHLTQSFRYGEAIADVATDIICGEVIVRGSDNIESEIVKEDDLPMPYTKLYRTNAQLISEALDFMEDDIEVSCMVDTKDYVKFLTSAEELHYGNNKKVKHDKVVPYSTWKDFVDAGKDEPQIKSAAKAVESGLSSRIIRMAPRMKQKANAQVTLSTAHKSKGLEWENVALANDFPVTDMADISDQERNLLYVAVTRAIKRLSLNDAVKHLIGSSN
jgi:superfamily I DNA/RNA helicase